MQFSGLEAKQQIEKVIVEICTEEDVSVLVLRAGSRLRHVAQARKRIIRKLVEELGVSLAETARQLGVSTSAISKTLTRATQNKSQQSQ